ncbi:MAG: hypothetical protein ACXVY6_14205, partial [Gaiellaceae bacterium]
MRVLVLLLGVATAVAAVTAATFLSNGPVGPGTATAAPQHLTLKVLTDNDRMLGSNLVARPGEIVLTVVNYARHAHTFSLPGLGVERVVLPGSPTHPTITIVRFKARTGSFTWYCKLPCGKTMSGNVYISSKPPHMHGPLWAILERFRLCKPLRPTAT